MVGDREGQTGLGDICIALREPGECMKRAFMHVMAVDPEQRLAILRRTISCAAHNLSIRVSG